MRINLFGDVVLSRGGRCLPDFPQFETCARLLEQEMGIQPMTETLKLRESIRVESLRPVGEPERSSPIDPRSDVSVDGAAQGSPLQDSPLYEIRGALRDFQMASARLLAGLRKVGLEPEADSRSGDSPRDS